MDVVLIMQVPQPFEYLPKEKYNLLFTSWRCRFVGIQSNTMSMQIAPQRSRELFWRIKQLRPAARPMDFHKQEKVIMKYSTYNSSIRISSFRVSKTSCRVIIFVCWYGVLIELKTSTSCQTSLRQSWPFLLLRTNFAANCRPVDFWVHRLTTAYCPL